MAMQKDLPTTHHQANIISRERFTTAVADKINAPSISSTTSLILTFVAFADLANR